MKVDWVDGEYDCPGDTGAVRFNVGEFLLHNDVGFGEAGGRVGVIGKVADADGSFRRVYIA